MQANSDVSEKFIILQYFFKRYQGEEETKMSHDKKKKSKSSIEEARVPVEAVVVAGKGSDDVKTGVKGIVPDTKGSANKSSKSKKR